MFKKKSLSPYRSIGYNRDIISPNLQHLLKIPNRHLSEILIKCKFVQHFGNYIRKYFPKFHVRQFRLFLLNFLFRPKTFCAFRRRARQEVHLLSFYGFQKKSKKSSKNVWKIKFKKQKKSSKKKIKNKKNSKNRKKRKDQKKSSKMSRKRKLQKPEKKKLKYKSSQKMSRKIKFKKPEKKLKYKSSKK